MVEKYYKDGKMAILVSPGFGAGWSTWNQPEIAIDRRIVEKFINEHPSADEMEDFIGSLGYKRPYMGGYEEIEVMWVPKGERYLVTEYDGHEELLISSEMDLA